MVLVQLRTVGTLQIAVDVVLDDCALLSVSNSPSTLVDFFDIHRMTLQVSGFNMIHELGEISDLVQGIPYRQLQFTFRFSMTQAYLDPHHMFLLVRKRDSIPSRGALLSWQRDCETENNYGAA
jgi:hypothetical protein